jgi:hypothetical protein
MYTFMNEEQRKEIRIVEKGSNQYVEKIKYVREQTGLGLREAKDLCDYGVGLSAGEIVERQRANRASGIQIDTGALPTICWSVSSVKYPELNGFYAELSHGLRELIASGCVAAFELTSKSEALSQMHSIARLAPLN